MKKFLPIASIVFLFAACTSSTKSPITSTEQLPLIDTTGLAQFQNWKAQNELVQAQAPDNNEKIEAQAAAPRPRTIAPVRKRAASARSNSEQSTVDNTPGSVASSEGANTAKAPVRKVSKAAKGAVIGGVGGAAAGAVINKKNRVVGAVIGAVVGAGGGYVIGRGMDKKDGRYLIPSE